MTDILCQWLNEDVGLSRRVDPSTFAREFSTGYLIGEILNHHKLQDDFDQFSKGRNTISQINNFQRLFPTLQLLGVMISDKVVMGLVQQEPGVATRLLYQIYIALRRKENAQLSKLAMETMRPSATAKLASISSKMYNERLKSMIPREVDVILRNVSSHFVALGKEIKEQVKQKQEEELQKKQDILEQQRTENQESLREAKRKNEELMAKIQASLIHVSKPVPRKIAKIMEKRKEELRKKEAEMFMKEINDFETILTKLEPTGAEKERERPSSTVHVQEVPSPLKEAFVPCVRVEEDHTFIENVRKRLDEEGKARKQREKRRRRVLLDQLQAHEAQEEVYREEQLVNRLMRQSLQERRIAVQLMLARHEKQVITQNRIFREKQYEEKRLQEFQEVLDKEAVLVRQERLEHTEQIQREREVHERIMAQRAEQRFRKHYSLCQEVVEHIIDLVTKIAEYRELTLNLIPVKMMREWKEMFFHEIPFYEQPISKAQSETEGPADAVQQELMAMLNTQDYEDYKMMTGDWLPPEGGDIHGPPANNNILGHVVARIFEIVHPVQPPTPPPVFPPFPIKACILGKVLAGKSTCLKDLAEALQIHVLVPDVLVGEAVRAYEEGETMAYTQTQENGTEAGRLPQVSSDTETLDHASFAILDAQETAGSPQASSSQEPSTVPTKNPSKERLTGLTELTSQSSKTLAETESSPQVDVQESAESEATVPSKIDLQPSIRAELGARASKFLRKGSSVPDELLVEIIVASIRTLPVDCGWILDGFPVTVHQAKLLEKWLTGRDPDKAAGHTKKSKTSLVFDPRAPKDPPPPQPALDIAILLDVSDNTVLARHSESTISSVSGSESLRSGSMQQSSQRTLAVRESSSHEQEQLVPRLTGFLDHWPKLEEWFEVKQKILVRVNGELEHAELLEKLELVLVEALYKKQCKDVVSEKPVEAEMLPSPTQAESTPSPVSQEKIPKEGKSIKSDSVSALSSIKIKSKTSVSARDKKQEKSGSFTHSASAKGKKGKGKQDPSPPDTIPSPQPPRPPPPKPGSDQWVYVDEPVPQEVAEYLAPYWSSIENTYINTIQNMMQEERRERDCIIHYLHKIRVDFQEYLESRPDHKQEFVTQWQNDYNSISEDLRHDDDVKAELFLRLYNLRERLWDISDTRKEEAERERMNLMGNGWLEDHLGLLLNIYTTLMQVEIDRFQDTFRFLQDYYKVMEGTIPPEDSKEFARIPLVSVPDVQIPATMPAMDPVSAYDPSQSEPQREAESSLPVTDSKSDPQEDEVGRHVIPLVPYRIPSSSLAVKDKGKSLMKLTGKLKEESAVLEISPPLTNVDEYLIMEAYQTATATLSNIIQTEMRIKEEEERKEQKLKEEKEKELQKSAGKDSKKKGGKSADKKKGRQSLTPSVPPPVVENPEVARKQELREHIYTEYLGALEDEAQAVRLRLERIKLMAMAVVQELKSKAAEIFTIMEDQLGARFLQEMESINTLLDITLGYVDAGTKIEHQLILKSKEFFVNGDVKVVPDPPPFTREPSKEIPKEGELTIEQLTNLHRQFMLVAPTGVMLKKEFIEILQDLVTVDLGTDQMPDQWSSISYSQVLDITRILTAESDLLDWRQFLLSAAQPWPYPSLAELLDTKIRFQAIDVADTGFVTKEQYDQIELWFQGDDEVEPSDDPTAPLPFQRLKQLKQAFFTLFADESRSPPELEYNNMLLYFAAHREPTQGFHRSLSLAAGTILTWNPEPDSTTLWSEPYIDRQSVRECPSVLDAPPDEAEMVPIYALFQILTHGAAKTEDTHRHSNKYETEQLYCKHLTQVYNDLGSKNFEAVPFQILLRHPFIMDLIQNPLKFTLPDFKPILQRKPAESEAIASSSPELSVETSSNTPTEETGASRRRLAKS
ncbi:sperm flagellar protein 2 [Hemiscyllium ocellatum]|uniref:sperm flagellar protein 2 n=1 Tax=Hemiscyllium ocellatum TaxID=170820 RepID=UPI002966E1ED|nr:sperm flagellar protein 2 [Hemiscyllium ocellatum]